MAARACAAILFMRAVDSTFSTRVFARKSLRSRLSPAGWMRACAHRATSSWFVPVLKAKNPFQPTTQIVACQHRVAVDDTFVDDAVQCEQCLAHALFYDGRRRILAPSAPSFS